MLSGSLAVVAGDGKHAPDMDERTLTAKYHLPATKEGLLVALLHGVPEVRSFAAQKLAADGEKSAAPAILHAVSVESNPGTMIIMASSAAKLGEEEGTAALRRMCHDTRWSAGLRLSAVGAILDLGRDECLDFVLDVLRGEDHPQDTPIALNFLSKFQHPSWEEAQGIRNAFEKALRSSMPGVKVQAGISLRKYRETWAFEMLKNAIALESDDGVRTLLQEDLAAMQPR